MRNARKIVASAGAVVMLGLAAAPAHAENYRDTSLTGWRPWAESSRWKDNNRDAVKTSVRFADCHTDGGGGGLNSATLALYKDVFGPDENKGSRTNKCNTYTWGDESAGDYYFVLKGFNPGGVLTVKSIRISW